MGRIPAWWGGLSRRGKIITAVIVLVVLAAIGGSARTTPSASPSVSPAASSGVADVGKAIPGLTAADVKLNLTNKGLTCTGPSSLADGISYSCTGTNPARTIDWRVDMIGSDPLTIRSVDATVLWSGSGDGEAAFDDFLGYIATLPYDGAQPAVARAWVQANTSGTGSFGGATFTISSASTDRARSLTIHGGTDSMGTTGAPATATQSPTTIASRTPTTAPTPRPTDLGALGDARAHILATLDAFDALTSTIIAQSNAHDSAGLHSSIETVQKLTDDERHWLTIVAPDIAAVPAISLYSQKLDELSALNQATLDDYFTPDGAASARKAGAALAELLAMRSAIEQVGS